MKYTLYIDESGDFESSRGQWVLAGILIAENYVTCEKILSRKFDMVPQQMGLRSIKDFHLTEFRREFGHETAVKMAKQVYKKLDALTVKYHAIASINYTKSSLSTREKTYRLMLADILAICETSIPDDEVITKLDLVVASRTIGGELQTSISNIDQDIIQSLPIALEVDLATKGLVDLMGKNIKIHMDYANNSWGLVCADFLANLNYHNRRDNERSFLEELRLENKYSLFESFGSFDVRRAHVAERNNDYVLALYRWINISYVNNADTKAKAKESIQRLFEKTFNTRGTSGYVVSFEALIERLWRNNNTFEKYASLSQKLSTLDFELNEYVDNISPKRHDNLVFRLRNLRLIIENHLGRTTEALLIIAEQNKLVPTLATNPEYFKLVLDFKVTETETHLNSLELNKALTLAIDYSKIIESYRDVWALLLNDDELSGFNSSRANIKSEMTLLRINIICIGLYDSLPILDIDSRLSNIRAYLSNKIDISRFNNYKIMLLLKQRKSIKAVSWYINKYADPQRNNFSIFDTLWFLKAVNDTLLVAKDIDISAVDHILESSLSLIDLNKLGHPVDLVLRELALYELQKGNKTKAMKYISKSSKAFDLGGSEISLFLKIVTQIHNDYINGKLKPDKEYFNELKHNEFVQKILSSTIELPFLMKVRYFSLY